MTARPVSRAALRSRMRFLAVVEAFNVGWLALMLFGAARVPPSAANVVGYGLVALLVSQGAWYWAAKDRQLRDRARAPAGLGAFRVLRWVNPCLLGAGLAVIGPAAWQQPGARSLPGLAFLAFAVVEHVNYFHLQLQHDTRADLRRLARTRRLHPSHLAIDLRRHR